MVHMYVGQKLLICHKIKGFLDDRYQVLNAALEET